MLPLSSIMGGSIFFASGFIVSPFHSSNGSMSVRLMSGLWQRKVTA